MTEALRERCARALHLLRPDGSVLVGEQAVLHLYAALGYDGVVAPLRVPPLSWLAAAGYRAVARNRRWFARFLFREPE